MKAKVFGLAGLLIVVSCSVAGCKQDGQADSEDAAVETISLAGKWRFRIDADDVGEAGKWFLQELPETIELPGSMAENGYGNDVNLQTDWTGQVRDPQWYKDPRWQPYTETEDFKFPFWLQPVKHYVGPAWYQRDIVIPQSWQTKHISLLLERCHWTTKVWVDGEETGSRDSLSTPHLYELGPLAPGKHTLTICVDNTVEINVGTNAHSVSDHTQTNWNGITGKIQLQATDPVRIDDVQVYPDVANKTAKVKVTISNATGSAVEGTMDIQAESFNAERLHRPPVLKAPVNISGEEQTIEVDYVMGEQVLLWDEFAPNLYRMTVSIEGSGFTGSRAVTFGIRNIGVEGTQFTINGRKIFLRGTLECCIFPLTGYSPTDVAGWMKVLTAAGEHGLNHLRFHSWCPPEAAFEAADRMGFYYQVEGPFWTAVGNGGKVDEYIYAECDRILKAYGNHPSFCLMAYGNEPGGGNQREFLGKLVDYWKDKDPRHKYTSASGWPSIPENEFHSTPRPRIQQWGQGLASRINAEPPETRSDYTDFINNYDVPVVAHEIGQWCVYPNFEEIKKYTGVTRARNFEIFRDILEKNHMGRYAHDFLIASGKLQALCYKEDIESALRTKGFGGFQLLDLHDFPGQGTALVGVLDPFWEYKGYVTADEYSRFCNHTVPLARMSKRIWRSDETFEADIELAHFGSEALQNAVIDWKLAEAGGKIIGSGSFNVKRIPVDNGIAIGTVEAALAGADTPGRLSLEVTLQDTEYANSWDVWVFAPDVQPQTGDEVTIVDRLDEPALEKLSAGEKVMLIPAAGTVKGDEYGKVPPAFSSIFWNTAWTDRQPPHTLGILCEPEHPALVAFPTAGHSDWQWWDLVTKSQIMILDKLPAQIRPIVRVIDDWFTARRLGLIFEAEVNGGRLLVCGIDLRSDLDRRPVARQMLHSLLEYMRSSDFAPQQTLEPAKLQALFSKPPKVVELGAKVISVDSEEHDTPAQKALDGDTTSIWHTEWRESTPDYPHSLVIEIGKSVTLTGFEYVPRQDMTNGWISEYRFYVSDDPQTWSEPVASGTFKPDKSKKTVSFQHPAKGRYIRFVAVKGIEGQKYASIAELDVICE